jgi:hypothetical protein
MSRRTRHMGSLQLRLFSLQGQRNKLGLSGFACRIFRLSYRTEGVKSEGSQPNTELVALKEALLIDRSLSCDLLDL